MNILNNENIQVPAVKAATPSLTRHHSETALKGTISV